MSVELAALGIVPVVKSRVVTAPPGSPATGDRYIVAATHTGAWAGFSPNDIASWTGSAWINASPVTGSATLCLDDGLTVRYDGTSWNVQNAITLAADFTTASISLVDVTNMVFSLASGFTYVLEGCLFVNTSGNATPGYAYNFSGTTSALVSGASMSSVASLANSTGTSTWSNANNTALNPTGGGFSGSRMVYTYSTLTATSSGTVQLRVQVGANTLTIKAGSWMRVAVARAV